MKIYQIEKEINNAKNAITPIDEDIKSDILHIMDVLDYVIEMATDEELNDLFQVLIEDISFDDEGIDIKLINGFA